MDVFPGDELSFVITCTIIEKKFDVSGQEGSRMGIDRMV